MRTFSALQHTKATYLWSETNRSCVEAVFHLFREAILIRGAAKFNYPICLMRCNHTDGMPREDFNIYFASSRGGYVRAEEAVGITFLAVILAALFVLGCWYFKKRSGYKIIRSPMLGSSSYTGGQYSEAGPSADNKMALTDFGSFPSFPNAPPVYEKISSGPLPPPYSP